MSYTIFKHKGPIFPPLLNIEYLKYYLYEAIYCIPLGFLFWIIVAGFIQIIVRHLRGKGTF